MTSVKSNIWIFAPQSQYVMPYMERCLSPYYELCSEEDGRDRLYMAVMISSVQIYDVTSGTSYNELTPIDPESPWNYLEQRFISICDRRGIPPVILRCASIVGTGMNGSVMDLVRGLNRGLVRHILPATGTRRSLVHAVDLPEIIRELANVLPKDEKSPVIYNVTDGVETDVDYLIEALAHRLNDKRISTVKHRWSRLLMGSANYRYLTTTLTFSNARLMNEIQYIPTVVTDYLLTHTYDHDSL